VRQWRKDAQRIRDGEREVYDSAGIECSTLWECDVLERWDSVGPMVLAWLERAIEDMNEKSMWRKRC